MAKTRFEVLSEKPVHIRVTCECGKYIHELKAGENGKPVFDTFLVNRPPEEETPAPKKKGKGFLDSFFETDEEG
jgi:hypothetical protein